MTIAPLLPIDEGFGERGGVFYPLGSSLPIAVADAVSGRDGQLQLITKSIAEWKKLRTLIGSQRVLLVQKSWGDQAYVRLNLNPAGSGGVQKGDRTVEVDDPSGNFRTTTVPWVEVAAP
jgi:hypothetical protein